MKVKNEPIVLSGRVYLDGILAEDLSRLALPARLLVGDIKLHNVRKPGNRTRFGQDVSFSGFIVANIYDGKRFRRLLLRKLGAVESTYVGPVERRERSASVVRYLSTLVRRQAVWFAQDSGYEVTRNTVAAAPVQVTPTAQEPKPPQTKPVAQPVAEPVAEAKTVTTTVSQPVAIAPVAGQAGVTVEVTVAVTVKQSAPEAAHGRTIVPAKRRTRRRKVDENQLTLFTDVK